MTPEAYRMLAERQHTYWWHRARRTMALLLLRRYGLGEGCRWIDIGCGPGGNLGLFDSLHPCEVVGVDLSEIALEFAATSAPASTLVRANINERLPFADESFDVATLFNVLYHQWVRDEGAVIAEAARVLHRRGLLLLTEPAFDALRRELDDAVMTRRRYRVDDFKTWLDRAGFEVLFSSYFTSFGFPLLLVAKALGRKGSDMRPLSKPVNEAFLRAALIEACAIARGVRMPFGTTLVIVARRR